MLAREIIEDSLLSFLTREASNIELAGETISQKVIIAVTYMLIIIIIL